VLNGFGPADEIDKIVSDLKRQHKCGRHVLFGQYRRSR
jgi:hypothetical protein